MHRRHCLSGIYKGVAIIPLWRLFRCKSEWQNVRTQASGLPLNKWPGRGKLWHKRLAIMLLCVRNRPDFHASRQLFEGVSGRSMLCSGIHLVTHLGFIVKFLGAFLRATFCRAFRKLAEDVFSSSVLAEYAGCISKIKRYFAQYVRDITYTI